MVFSLQICSDEITQEELMHFETTWGFLERTVLQRGHMLFPEQERNTNGRSNKISVEN